MQQQCSVPQCTETAATSAEGHSWCPRHFLLQSYQRLEGISAQLHQRQFEERQAEAAARFLESCMRDAADIACEVAAPTNLERAQVLDVLLWASELHGKLRRSSRVPARIPILLRSDAPEPWQEKTETVLLSRYGAQVSCRHEVVAGEKLILVCLDKGWEAEVRVAWSSRKDSGETDMGVEFLGDRNFWELGTETSAFSPRNKASAKDTVVGSDRSGSAPQSHAPQRSGVRARNDEEA